MNRYPCRSLAFYPYCRIVRVSGISVHAERDHSVSLLAEVVEVRLVLGACHAVICLKHLLSDPHFKISYACIRTHRSGKSAKHFMRVSHCIRNASLIDQAGIDKPANRSTGVRPASDCSLKGTAGFVSEWDRGNLDVGLFPAGERVNSGGERSAAPGSKERYVCSLEGNASIARGPAKRSPRGDGDV